MKSIHFLGVFLTSLALAQLIDGEGLSLKLTGKSRYSAKVGAHEVRLVCKVRVVSGSDETLNPDHYTFRWLRDGKEIRNGGRYRIKPFSYLKIKNVVLEDNGDYKCVVTKKQGIYLSITRELVVQRQGGPPKFSKYPRMSPAYVAVPVGETTRLRCSATGNPEPTVVWYKDGSKFTTRVRNPVDIKPDTLVLTLKNTIPSDSGKYVCNVSNVHGWINYTYNVQVQETLRHKPIIEEMQNYTAAVGTNLTMTCTALSHHGIHYQWLRWREPEEGSRDQGGTMVVLSDRSGGISKEITKNQNWRTIALTMYNVTVEDTGKYHCMVGNLFGFTVKTTWVYIRPQ